MNSEQQKKEFTGVWIPRHIIEDDSLSMTDRTIYAEVACFNVCYKSNEKLGERYGLKPNTISIIVSKLKKKGYVISLGMEDGRRRKLKAIMDKPNQRHPLKKIKGTLSKKSKGGFEKNQRVEGKIYQEKHFLDNSKDNIKENKVTKVSEIKISQLQNKNPDSFSVKDAEVEEISDADKILDEANNFDSPFSAKRRVKPTRLAIVKLAEQESGGAWLNKKLGKWLRLSPQNVNLYKNNTERKKLAELYEKYPEEQVDYIVSVLPQTNSLSKDEFFWKVFKPSELVKYIDRWIVEFRSKLQKKEKESKHVEFI
ncbi:MAG: hypothetical protein PHQ20_00665 [Candidatus Moranbacteria bacterium]|nr:hypothetical protein [Candidatus Moranbacteria bacterium]